MTSCVIYVALVYIVLPRRPPVFRLRRRLRGGGRRDDGDLRGQGREASRLHLLELGARAKPDQHGRGGE